MMCWEGSRNPLLSIASVIASLLRNSTRNSLVPSRTRRLRVPTPPIWDQSTPLDANARTRFLISSNTVARNLRDSSTIIYIRWTGKPIHPRGDKKRFNARAIASGGVVTKHILADCSVIHVRENRVMASAKLLFVMLHIPRFRIVYLYEG